MSSDDLLRSIAQLHQAGRLSEARNQYLELLAREPRNAQALNLLGVLLGQLGDWPAAARHIEQAIAIDPNDAGFHANLAEAYCGSGQLAAGIDAYKRAVALAPHVAELHQRHAQLLQQVGRYEDAAASYQAALRANPNFAQAHCNLADLLQVRGNASGAIRHYREALRLRPDHVEVMVNLGNALRETNDPESALPLLEQAVKMRPDVAAAHNNLGAALQDLARLDEARACYARAVELNPAQPEFHMNLASALRDLGDWNAALAECEVAARLAPANPQIRYRLGTLLLALGRFAEGWQAYEARIQCPQFQIPTYPKPRWQGEPLRGKTLLVHAEQGLGDTLQFIRYVNELPQFGGRVIVAAQRALLPLLSESGFIGLVAGDGPLPPFDCYVPLLSLPAVFRTDLTNVPCPVPYLHAEPRRIKRWARELDRHRGLRIGIAWQGRSTFRGDRLRSIPLAAFEPLAARGATLVSLQKGAGSEQLKGLWGLFEVVDLGETVDAEGAFLDTAAVMKNLDVVITSDSATAHLAGGLGVPVWVALALAPEWRWLTTGDRSAWYPTMRLFRQARFGQWSDVFERMACELATLAPRGSA